MTTVVGLFKQYANAETALDRLLAAGFSVDQITAIVPEAAAPKSGPVVPTAAANTGGVASGPGILGLGGAVAGMKGTMMPAIGEASAGGAASGSLQQVDRPDILRKGRDVDADKLAAALADRGLPQDLAQLYADGVRRGYVLLAVETEDRLSDAKLIMNDVNAADPIALRKEFEFLDRSSAQ